MQLPLQKPSAVSELHSNNTAAAPNKDTSTPASSAASRRVPPPISTFFGPITRNRAVSDSFSARGPEPKFGGQLRRSETTRMTCKRPAEDEEDHDIEVVDQHREE
jgi:hypothetical protein